MFSLRPFFFALSLWFFSQAQAMASDPVVYYDTGGFPRCIAHPQESQEGLLLFWDEETPYPRKLYAYSLSELEHRTPEIEYFSRTCEHWAEYAQVLKLDLLGPSADQAVPEGDQEVKRAGFRYVFSSDMMNRLAQVKLGARVYHAERTGEEFLQNHPLQDFTRETNRKLTQLYGIGFVADIYKAYVESLPRNRNVSANVDRAITAMWRTDSKASALLRQQLGQYLMIFAEGYMQTPKSSRFKPLFEELKAAGAQLQVMEFDALGPMEGNARRFKKQVLEALRSGKQVILGGASKGVPELLTALAEIQREEPVLAKQVRAVLNFAGMFDGSFLVDWAGQVPQRWFVSDTLRPQAERVGLHMEDGEGFFAMNTETMRAQARYYAPSLSRDTRFYNFVGVLTHNGLTRDREIGMLQSELSTRISKQGANDGYIEYPGTTMPEAWGLNAVDIVFDSSHAILDGSYHGLDLKDPQNLRRVSTGIFSMILSDISQQ